MTTARQQDQTEEGLDWLHLIAEELREQNTHLRAIRRHTGVLYALAVVWIVVTVLGVVGWVLSTH